MDPVIQLLTELRDNMNARFERTEKRMAETHLELKREISHVRVALERDISHMHVALARDIATVNARFDDVLLDRRDMRTRLERCERDIDDLKRR